MTVTFKVTVTSLKPTSSSALPFPLSPCDTNFPPSVCIAIDATVVTLRSHESDGGSCSCLPMKIRDSKSSLSSGE